MSSFAAISFLFSPCMLPHAHRSNTVKSILLWSYVRWQQTFFLCSDLYRCTIRVPNPIPNSVLCTSQLSQKKGKVPKHLKNKVYIPEASDPLQKPNQVISTSKFRREIQKSKHGGSISVQSQNNESSLGKWCHKAMRQRLHTPLRSTAMRAVNKSPPSIMISLSSCTTR